MTTVYKLTKADHTTRSGMQWGEGVEHTAPGGGTLCANKWLHAYAHPYQAAIFRCLHVANYPVLWECDADVGLWQHDKIGCTRIKTLRQVPLPEISTNARVRWAIYVARQVCSDRGWLKWAEQWCSGADRSESAAWSAAESAAESAAWYAAGYAGSAAGYAARYAGYAARYAGSAAGYAGSAASDEFWRLLEQAIKDEAAFSRATKR